MNRAGPAFLVLALVFSAPAWSHPGFTDKDGCHTTRKWERHCHETVTLVTEAIDSALARAYDRAPAGYQAMEQARSRASGRIPGAYKKSKADAKARGQRPSIL